MSLPPCHPAPLPSVTCRVHTAARSAARIWSTTRLPVVVPDLHVRSVKGHRTRANRTMHGHRSPDAPQPRLSCTLARGPWQRMWCASPARMGLIGRLTKLQVSRIPRDRLHEHPGCRISFWTGRAVSRRSARSASEQSSGCYADVSRYPLAASTVKSKCNCTRTWSRMGIARTASGGACELMYCQKTSSIASASRA